MIINGLRFSLPVCIAVFVIIFTCPKAQGKSGEERFGGSAADVDSIKTIIECLIEERQYDAALQKISDLPADAWTYLQRGRIHRGLQEWDEAIAALQSAKNMRYHYGRACYELGRVYEEGPFDPLMAREQYSWAYRYDRGLHDAGLRKAGISMRVRGYTYGIRELAVVVRRDPRFADCYTLFTTLAFAFHEPEQAADVTETLMKTYPEEKQYAFDLIHALYAAGDFTKAEQCLSLYGGVMIKNCPSLYWLHKSKVDLALGQDIPAWDEYRKGLGFLKSDEEANVYYDDIRYIVTNEEADQFRNCDITGKRSFFYIFWKSRDPTLTTDFNERVPEHYKRLRYALQYNKRYPEDQDLSYFLGEQEAAVAKDDLMTRFGKSRECINQQMIDDMGIIYVRHGNPDMFYTNLQMGALLENINPVVFSAVPQVPTKELNLRPGAATGRAIPGSRRAGGDHFNSQKLANVSWVYESKYGRPAMNFHFWRSGRIDQDRTFSNRKSRVHRGWILRSSALYPPSSTEKQLNYVFFPEDPLSISEAIAVGTSTTTTDYRPERDLRFNYKSYIYQDGAAEKIYVYVDVCGGEIGNAESPVVPERDVVLLDQEWKTFFRTSSDEPSAFPDNPGLHCVKIEVVPGVYTLGIRVIDRENKAENSADEQLVINDLHSGGLALSSLMMADLEPNRHLFVEIDTVQCLAGMITPNMEDMFRRGVPMVVYFEIYNLVLDTEGHSDATVVLNILRHTENGSSPDQWTGLGDVSGSVEIEHTLRGSRRDERYLQSLDLSQYPAGSYTLQIKITDNHINADITEKASFIISHD